MPRLGQAALGVFPAPAIPQGGAIRLSCASSLAARRLPSPRPRPQSMASTPTFTTLKYLICMKILQVVCILNACLSINIFILKVYNLHSYIIYHLPELPPEIFTRPTRKLVESKDSRADPGGPKIVHNHHINQDQLESFNHDMFQTTKQKT